MIVAAPTTIRVADMLASDDVIETAITSTPGTYISVGRRHCNGVNTIL